MKNGGIKEISLLDAIRSSMSDLGRPMSAKEISSEIQEQYQSLIGGKTPWKTVGARLASDIRDNPKSKFVRAGRGLYALKEWNDVTQFDVKPRKINPLEENILVVSRSKFLELLSECETNYLKDASLKKIMNCTTSMRRLEAEETDEFVQLIPSFIIFKSDQVLSYKRTKKSPESRLHESYSIIFGGHLQEEDNPSLFQENTRVMRDFIFRELYEELEFSRPISKHNYCGILYLEETQFERQHAGIIFAIDIEEDTTVGSGEPGYHSNLQFLDWHEIHSSSVIDDKWSNHCIKFLQQSGV